MKFRDREGIAVLMVEKGQRYRTLRELPAGCVMTWAAPFATGGDVVLPLGEQFIISENPPRTASAAICMPVRYEFLHLRFVPQAERESGRYTGYYLVIDLDEIEQHCELVEENSLHRIDRIEGLLLGTAAGDALGLHREGMSRRRAIKMFGAEVKHGFIFGRGMVSDDTEHTCMTAQAILARPDDPEKFARSLAWRLRLWLLGLPAGMGFGTLRAILKLWVGFSPGNSGVNSAGNGPAMRSAVIGACFFRDVGKIKEFVKASSELTHTDPRAREGALAVALGAAYACSRNRDDFKPEEALGFIRDNVESHELIQILDRIFDCLKRGDTAEAFAEEMGMTTGVSGYIYQTVPASLFCWLSHPNDFRKAVGSVILMGGDTDTTGAITGALSGVTVGEPGIPDDFKCRLLEWPRSTNWMGWLARRLAAKFPQEEPPVEMRPVPLFWPAIPFRNLFFLVIVLLHGLRRLLPPY